MLVLLRSIVITLVAAAVSLAIGGYCGSAFGYGLSWVSGRDPAELKDVLIWCMIGGSAVFATGAVWASTHFLSAARWIRFAAGALFCLAVLASAGIVTAAYIEAPRYGPR